MKTFINGCAQLRELNCLNYKTINYYLGLKILNNIK